MNENDKKVLDELTDVLLLKFGYKLELKPVVAKTVKRAYGKVLDYTNRDSLIGNMEDSVYELSVISSNRDGNEGELSRSEGGVSQSFVEGIPKDIKSSLNRYRLGSLGSL